MSPALTASLDQLRAGADVEVAKLAAAFVARRAQDEELAPIVIRAFNDPRAEVRLAAARSLPDGWDEGPDEDVDDWEFRNPAAPAVRLHLRRMALEESDAAVRDAIGRQAHFPSNGF